MKGSVPLAKGDDYVRKVDSSGKPGEQFLLFGYGKGKVESFPPVPVNEATLDYVLQVPPAKPVDMRLAHFAKFLEDPEPVIANDAFAELTKGTFTELAALAKDFSRDTLRKWIADPEIPEHRTGLYGMMLGLCGDEDDAGLLEKKMLEPNDDFRPGIGGVMSGYLLLTGEKGLAVIDREAIDKKERVSFSETFGAVQAVRFMWDHGNGRIEPERLRQSMRLLLKRRDFADLVIPDLARWKDWTVRGQLMEMYDSDEFNLPVIKRAIVRYLLACSGDLSTTDGTPNPVAIDAMLLLDRLRKKDPETVSEAERSFVLP